MKPLALSVFAAVLTVLVFPRFDFTWLAPLSLVPLLLASTWEERPLRRLLCGLAAGTVYWGGVCYWIQAVLEQYGGLNMPLAWLSFFLFCLLKGLHWAVFTWLAGYLMTLRFAMLAVPALWVGLERTNGPLGFAWLTMGNAGIDMGVPMRLAPMVGVYGVSFAFLMMNVAVAMLLLKRPRIELAPLILLPLLYILPALPESQPGKEVAVVMQPNIEERDDWDRSRLETTVRGMVASSLEAATSTNPGPHLVLWPEAPAPFYYDQDPFFREQVTQLATLTRSFVLFAAVGHTDAGGPQNSAYMVGSDGAMVARYDKMYLVPFGEFVPWPFGWVNQISQEAGEFVPGKNLRTFPTTSARLGAFICYESVFPHFVREFPLAGANLLVNLSNDGYFGKSAARQQHLSVARMRAAENRRWLIRATNNGITSVIDPAGRVDFQIPPDKKMASRVRFSLVNETTAYTRHGDWFAWMCLMAGAGASIACLFRKRRSGASADAH